MLGDLADNVMRYPRLQIRESVSGHNVYMHMTGMGPIDWTEV